MTPYQLEWLESAGGPRRSSGRWARWLAPIITAILVVILGATVFGLMAAPGDSVGGSSSPPAADVEDSRSGGVER